MIAVQYKLYNFKCTSMLPVNYAYPMVLFFLCTSTGFTVTKAALDEVATLSEVMSVGDDYLSPAVRECKRVIPAINDVKPSDAARTYIFLKMHYEELPSTIQGSNI